MLLSTVFLILSIVHQIPWKFTILVFSRDICILIVSAVLYTIAGLRDFRPSMFGKANTFAQVAAVFFVLLLPVHHVAWATEPDEIEEWQRQVTAAGAQATPIIDRNYFRSVYFREPSGVLCELATIGPGFAVDEPQDRLGQKLSLTPQYEHLREQIEPTLTPLHNPRDSWARQ